MAVKLPEERKRKKKKKKTTYTQNPAPPPLLSSRGSTFPLRSTWLISICEGQGTPAGEVKNGAAHVRGRPAHPGPLPDQRDCWKAIDSFWQRPGEKYFDHVTLYKLTSLLHVWNFYRRYKYRVCNRPQNPAPLSPPPPRGKPLPPASGSAGCKGLGQAKLRFKTNYRKQNATSQQPDIYIDIYIDRYIYI